MKYLPLPRNYYIGVHDAVYNDSEFFTYVVLLKYNGEITVIDQGIVRNDFKGYSESKFKEYCDNLSKHYAAPVFISP